METNSPSSQTSSLGLEVEGREGAEGRRVVEGLRGHPSKTSDLNGPKSRGRGGKVHIVLRQTTHMFRRPK